MHAGFMTLHYGSVSSKIEKGGAIQTIPLGGEGRRQPTTHTHICLEAAGQRQRVPVPRQLLDKSGGEQINEEAENNSQHANAMLM